MNTQGDLRESRQGCWALLPLKDLVQAKTRLGGVLASHERRALAQAMAEDVLTALTTAEGLGGVLLISDDPAADMLAAKYSIEWLPESALQASGLNNVVTAGCDWLRQAGVDAVMIVHSDLPLLQPASVERALRQFEETTADVLLVPDRRREGTNMLLARTSALPPFHYGHDSFTAHQQAAAEQGLSCEEQLLADVALDIDQPADLIDAWQALGAVGGDGTVGSHTRALLGRSDIARRLRALSDLYAANTRGVR